MITNLIAWIIAISLAGAMGLVIRGFLFIALSKDGTAVYHLGRGVVLILAALALRAVYWDGLPILLNALLGAGTWGAWSGVVGKPLPNILTGVVAIAGTWHMLKVQLLLIPEAERRHYSIWTAPFYPRRAMFSRCLALMRQRRRKDSRE